MAACWPQLTCLDLPRTCPERKASCDFSNGGGSVDKHGLHSQTLASLTREFGNDLNSSSTAMTHYA
jgi:hypothetical protein